MMSYNVRLFYSASTGNGGCYDDGNLLSVFDSEKALPLYPQNMQDTTQTPFASVKRIDPVELKNIHALILTERHLQSHGISDPVYLPSA
jgi:hypothetical protein